MDGDLEARGAAGLEGLGHAAVQRPPPQPGHVGVERLARQGVPEGAGPGALLAHQARVQQLSEGVVAGQPRHHLQVERVPRDGGDLGRPPRLLRELGDADQHRVAHGLRQVGRALARLGGGRPGELLDEEGDALGAVVDRRRQVRRGALAEQPPDQLRRLRGRQGRQGQLVQPAAAAQVVPQAAQPVLARQAVRAVRGDGQHRQPLERLGQPRQQLQARVVRPLQVVQHQQHEPVAGQVRERVAHRLEERRRVGGGGRAAQLGEDRRQLRAQPPAPVQGIGALAQARAERRHDGAEGGRRLAARAAPEDDDGRARGELLEQARLADPRLAGHEHERAAARAGAREGVLEVLSLGLAADERGARRHHSASLGPPRRGAPPYRGRPVAVSRAQRRAVSAPARARETASQQ